MISGYVLRGYDACYDKATFDVRVVDGRCEITEVGRGLTFVFDKGEFDGEIECERSETRTLGVERFEPRRESSGKRNRPIIHISNKGDYELRQIERAVYEAEQARRDSDESGQVQGPDAEQDK